MFPTTAASLVNDDTGASDRDEKAMRSAQEHPGSRAIVSAASALLTTGCAEGGYPVFRHCLGSVGLLILVSLVLRPPAAIADDWTLIGWNNLGMHCMDPDYSVFALLPPFNTLAGAAGRCQRRAGARRQRHQRSPTRRSPIPTARSTRPRPARPTSGTYVEALFGVALPVDVGPRRLRHARRGQSRRSR